MLSTSCAETPETTIFPDTGWPDLADLNQQHLACVTLGTSDTQVVEFKYRSGTQNRVGVGNVPHVNDVSQRFVFNPG